MLTYRLIFYMVLLWEGKMRMRITRKVEDTKIYSHFGKITKHLFTNIFSSPILIRLIIKYKEDQ